MYSSAVNCECGTHRDGITAYNVDGQDCCQDTSGEQGFRHTYLEQYPGVWVLDSSTRISGASAQNTCCNSVKV